MTDEIGKAILQELQQIRTLLAPDERAIPDHPMTFAEFGKIVGKHPKTIARWADRGKIRAVPIGGTRMISPVAARKFFGDGRID